jgi:hypothetical protein
MSALLPGPQNWPHFTSLLQSPDMKSYLRYGPKEQFGVIASPQCNVQYDYTGNLAFTGAIQEVCAWNLRQASQVHSRTHTPQLHTSLTHVQFYRSASCLMKSRTIRTEPEEMLQ